MPPPQEALKLLQTLLAHEPFACKLDAGAMLTSQCELEARLKVRVCGGRCEMQNRGVNLGKVVWLRV